MTRTEPSPEAGPHFAVTPEVAVKEGMVRLESYYAEYNNGLSATFDAYFVRDKGIHDMQLEAFLKSFGIRQHPVYPEHAITQDGVGLYITESDWDIHYSTHLVPLYRDD
jgi:hypothetical protein